VGTTAIVGSRIWECQYKFRIIMGPMGYSDYQRMLPGGDSLRRLVDWVKNYIGEELAWDVQLILKKEEVPAARLGASGRLGWSTWTKSAPMPRNADNLILDPRQN
jgi:type VI secretion system protein ImpH